MIDRMTIRCDHPGCGETISYIPGRPGSWNQYWVVFNLTDNPATEKHICPKHIGWRNADVVSMCVRDYPGQVRKDLDNNG